MKINSLNLEKEMYEKIRNFLSIKDLEDDVEFKEARQDDSIDLGSVVYNDGVEAKIALVSGITAYWIEVQLFKDNKAISELQQFYNIDNLLEVTVDCETYAVGLFEKDSYYEVVTYCWVNLKDNMFGEEWEENCMNGDFLYKVPTGWLIAHILTDVDYNTVKMNSYEGKNILEVFEIWDDTYTHEEGYNLYNQAVKDGILMDCKVVSCEYCSS